MVLVLLMKMMWSLMTLYGLWHIVDALGLINKALKNYFDPHTRWFNVLEEMKMMWALGVLEPLGMSLGQKGR